MGNEVKMAFDCYMHIYGSLMGNEVKNYVDIYFQYYQQGKRPIDAAKI
jgi:hypothetical protein